MARYHYTRENENGVVLYLESEPAEDAMDEFDDEIAVGFSGNGYLSFWTRCRKAAEALPNGLKYAVEQAFDGAMRDGALALLNRLVDSASEAANLEEELLNLKGEYQRSMENSKRGAFKRLDAAYKRKCRREKRMAKGQMLCADGKPVMFGETLYGGDGRDWLIVGIAGAWSYDVYGLHVAHDGKKEKKPLRAEWLVHELTDAGEEV